MVDALKGGFYSHPSGARQKSVSELTGEKKFGVWVSGLFFRGLLRFTTKRLFGDMVVES